MVTRRLRLGKRDAPSRANGTLLTTRGAGAMAWGRAFEEQYGVPASIDDYAGAGMPNREVGRVTFLKTAAHVEFDRSGRYALVSIWEDNGALVIYDASTFSEVKRIPMSRPSGKYNVWNKINFSDGTSH